MVAPLFLGYPFTFSELPTWNTANGGNFRPNNKRWGNTQEVRLSSNPGQEINIAGGKLAYVLGYFRQNTRASGHYNNIEDVESPTRIITGLTSRQRYGVTLRDGEYATRYQNLKDKEDAFFGELNYTLWDQLKFIAGGRYANTRFTYRQIFSGAINGNYDPLAVPGGVTNGTVNEKPISPRFSVQWQFTPDDQVYVTAAKGYRSGGVNSPLSEGQCGPALRELNLTVADIPNTYGSDTIWSYEAGTKLRMLNNRLAFNAAVYQLDWTGLQISVGPNRLGCGQQWVQNLGAARSRGIEIESQFRVFQGFTVSVNASYTSAKYTESALGPVPATPGVNRITFASAGQTLGQQPYRINLQGQYNWRLMDKFDAYVRADYTYTPQFAFQQVGQSGYSPDSAYRSKTEIANIRAGVTVDQVNVDLFVNNLFNSQDPLGQVSGGRTGCSAATGDACTVFTNYTPDRSFTSFRPREIGVQATYRF